MAAAEVAPPEPHALARAPEMSPEAAHHRPEDIPGGPGDAVDGVPLHMEAHHLHHGNGGALAGGTQLAPDAYGDPAQPLDYPPFYAGQHEGQYSDGESEEADPNAITGLFIPGTEGEEGGERRRRCGAGAGGRACMHVTACGTACCRGDADLELGIAPAWLQPRCAPPTTGPASAAAPQTRRSS